MRNSDADKLLRITALVLRFIHKLKGKLYKTITEYDDCWTSEEIKSAEIVWIKHVQETLFHEKTFTQTKDNPELFVKLKVFYGAQVEYSIQVYLMTLSFLCYC